MSRVLRVRGVDIGLVVYGNDKERVAEAAIQIRGGEQKRAGDAAGRQDAEDGRIQIDA